MDSGCVHWNATELLLLLLMMRFFVVVVVVVVFGFVAVFW
jgi:hypothetical protein